MVGGSKQATMSRNLVVIGKMVMWTEGRFFFLKFFL